MTMDNNSSVVVTTGASNHYLFKQKNIAANETIELLVEFGFNFGQILKIQVSHANINVFVSLVEYAKVIKKEEWKFIGYKAIY